MKTKNPKHPLEKEDKALTLLGHASTYPPWPPEVYKEINRINQIRGDGVCVTMAGICRHLKAKFALEMGVSTIRTRVLEYLRKDKWK